MSSEVSQQTFGWIEQGKCNECGQDYIRTYPAFIAEWHWNPGMFYSIKFCSQECANESIRKADEVDKQRRQWG